MRHLIILYKAVTMFLLLCLALAGRVQAQPVCDIRHYSFDDGLSQSVVQRIVQSSDGLLWFCTWDGLNSYDGSTFVSYNMASPGGKALSTNRIIDIQLGKDDDLWCQTYDARLFLFDRKERTFVDALAAVEDQAPTGRIESLFTVSEETGLDGANALEPGFISGKILINLDSEDEGELFVGCAGGIDTVADFNWKTKKLSPGTSLLKIKIYNGLGGHSGDDINKGRCNAVQQLSRFLYSEIRYGFDLCSIDGGNKRNAIAREAEAVISVPDPAATSARFDAFGRTLQQEFAVSEPGLSFESSAVSMEIQEAIEDSVAEALVKSMFAAPHGVLAMSMDIPNLVETSTNLASVKMTGQGKIRVGTNQRSSVTSEYLAAAAKVEACFSLAGARVTHDAEYPQVEPECRDP